MPAAAARVTDRMRALGARKIPRGRRLANRANAGGLTAREIEVLELIVEGLRNADIGRRLFISPKTVDHHVSAILGKIDVADRRAALVPPARAWGARRAENGRKLPMSSRGQRPSLGVHSTEMQKERWRLFELMISWSPHGAR